jgi:hypothetical protein
MLAVSAIVICSVGGAMLYNSKKSEVKKPSITSVEMLDRRTETKNVYLNSDGTVTERIYQNSINYKDGDVYKEIDNRLESQEVNGEKKLVNKANSVKVILDLQRKSDNLVNMKFDKYTVAFSPKVEEKYKNSKFTVLSLKKSDVDNGIVLKDNEQKHDSDTSKDDTYGVQYDNLYNDGQDVSFQYIPMSDGVKENIILNKYNNKNTFDFVVDLSGLTPEKVEHGGIILRDKETKEERAFIAPPFVHDSSKDQRETDNNSINIENIKGDQYKISIVVDKDYLENKNTVYPVVIDPYVTSLVTNHYALGSCIKSQYPDYNFASDPYLRTGNWTGSDPSGIMYSYLKFKNMPAVPGSKIIAAKMVIYSDNVGTGAMNVEMHRITTDWDYTTVKWNKRPVWDDAVESKITVTNNTGWFSWDITSLIKRMVDNSVPNYGIFMKKDDSASPTIRKFNSPSNSTNPPFLEVTYKVPDSPTMASATANSASEFINQSKGYVNLAWNPVSGADGYVIQVWNGSSYVMVQDVGNRTSWSTKERKFWPTAAEIAAGNGTIHGSDNNGAEYLPDNPHPVYVINKQTNPSEAYIYAFRVQAYYTAGDSKIMSPLIATNNINVKILSIPDTTAPKAVTNIKLSSKLTSDLAKWQIDCSFDQSTDNPETMATGISKYVVELYNSSNVRVDSKEVTTTSASFISDVDNTSYYAKIYAYDKNGNYVVAPNSSTVTTGTRVTSKEVVYFKSNKDTINVGDQFEIYVNAKGLDKVLASSLDFKYDNTLISVSDIVPSTVWDLPNAYTYKTTDTSNQGLLSSYSVKLNSSISLTDSTIFTIKVKALKAGTLSLKADYKNTALDNSNYNVRVKFSDDSAKLLQYQSISSSLTIK